MVILYLFLGGAAAGSLFMMSTWSLAFHRRDHSTNNHLHRAFKSLMARCYTIGFAVLAVAVICLIMDLGQPGLALLLFLKPHPSVLTIGSYALLLELLIGLLLAIANLFDLSAIGARARKALELACCACSLVVMLYTGVFLASNASVAFWNTWVLVLLFLFSSLSAGISMVLLIDYFIINQTILLRAARPLQKAHIAILLAESLALAAFVAVALGNPATSESVALLAEPTILSTAIVGVVGMGILVPLGLETYTLRARECRTIPVSDVICLLGCLCLRYVVVVCGVH
jgi:formate-dependent nitrite reductase membrane component NrfD